MGGKRAIRPEVLATGDGEEQHANEPVAWRFVGPGWVMGVPARDLTASDVAALDHDLWAQALALGIYADATAPAPATT